MVVDCEPDQRETTPGCPAPWAGFQGFYGYLSEQRPHLSARTGAPCRFSWFWRMDPQIELTYGRSDWAVRSYGRAIAETRESGDETGVHVHAWRWEPALRRWIADLADRDWVEHCVRLSLSQFKQSFGEPCRLFRFGDGWLDDPTVELIERLGIEVDLTLEPGWAERPFLVASELSTGLIPDRRRIPRRPYHPSTSDFRKPDRRGESRLWMLPVSTGRIARRMPRLSQFAAVKAWLAGPQSPLDQLNLGMEHEDFMTIFDQAVSTGARPYAAICVRTDVGSNDGLMQRVRQNLFGILEHRLAGSFVFTDPSSALSILVD